MNGGCVGKGVEACLGGGGANNDGVAGGKDELGLGVDVPPAGVPKPLNNGAFGGSTGFDCSAGLLNGFKAAGAGVGACAGAGAAAGGGAGAACFSSSFSFSSFLARSIRMASASRSCFSHFENTLLPGFGLPGVAGVILEIIRGGKESRRKPRWLATGRKPDNRRPGLAILLLSLLLVRVEAHRRSFPFA